MLRAASSPLTKTLLAIGAALGLQTASSSAAFILIEDFDDVALGADLSAINPGENFITNGTATPANIFMVEQDATDLTNQLLAFKPSTLNLYGYAPLIPQEGGAALTLAQGATGTLFFRMRRSATGGINYNFGVSDVAAPNDVSSFEAQMNFQSADIAVRDGASFVTTQMDFLADDWFGVFMVIDNLSDTVKYYVQPSADAAPTLLTGGDNSFGFRNGTANNALTNFMIYQQANKNPVFLDDIHFDPTGANLVAPTVIPEPGSMTLLVGAAGALLGFRRRQAVCA